MTETFLSEGHLQIFGGFRALNGVTDIRTEKSLLAVIRSENQHLLKFIGAHDPSKGESLLKVKRSHFLSNSSVRT
jgi:hypothetical protein